MDSGRFVPTSISMGEKISYCAIHCLRGGGCGNGGCPAVIYLNQKNGLYKGFPYGAHPRAVYLKQQSEHTGELRSYWHMSAATGVIGHDIVTEDNLKKGDDEDFSVPMGDPEDEYIAHFRDTKNLMAEYAVCKGGALTWSPSYEEVK